MADFAATIRAMLDVDRGFVVGHWLASYWVDAVPRRKGRGCHEPRADWKAEAKPKIGALLDRDVTLVACDPEDAERLYGFACGGPAALHYVFVRETRRRGGLGRDLLTALETERGAPYDLRATSYVTRTWLDVRDEMRDGRAAA